MSYKVFLIFDLLFYILKIILFKNYCPQTVQKYCKRVTILNVSEVLSFKNGIVTNEKANSSFEYFFTIRV